MNNETTELSVSDVKQAYESCMTEMKRVVMGADETLHSVLTAVFAGGHVLLEGVPGTAKTLIVRTMSHILNVDFERIQLTPDLMPSDITGTKVFNLQTNAFELVRGPIFCDILLADELNRTPPKTQAALLEAMQEHTCTIDGETILISDIFTVFGTQNPIEHEGVYPLPEAQVDRFMMKVVVGYPSEEDEVRIISAYSKGINLFDASACGVSPVLNLEQLKSIRERIATIRVEKDVLDYIVRLVRATREHNDVRLGASSRATIALMRAAQAQAAFASREFITPDDIKSVVSPVLGHRILLLPEAEISGMTTSVLLDLIVSSVKVPR